jgi:HSP20 family molecular chaperone IbpA
MTQKTMEIEKTEEQTAVDQPKRITRRTMKPRIDLFEAEDTIMLVADLPGVSQQDIEITLEKDRLTISGSMADRAPDGYRPVYSEFCQGDYTRSFILSDNIDRENIEASFENGVLRLSLPKAEKAKARKIALQSLAS